MYVLPYGQMSLWGDNICLTCLSWFNILNLENSMGFKINISFLFVTNDYISGTKIRGKYRIGSHNQDILSIIFGSLLGDAYGEKRSESGGTRISFYQESTHLSYILWLHLYLSQRGYCSLSIPKIYTRLGKKGKVRKVCRIHTWTFTSFNWIHELWYENRIKKIPFNISEFLTPLALAVWIMDDGAKVSKGLKLCTNSYSYSDCILLSNVLHKNFSLKSSINSAGVPNQYNIYIWKESMPLLREIVLPYIIPEMKYKILD